MLRLQEVEERAAAVGGVQAHEDAGPGEAGPHGADRVAQRTPRRPPGCRVPRPQPGKEEMVARLSLHREEAEGGQVAVRAVEPVEEHALLLAMGGITEGLDTSKSAAIVVFAPDKAKLDAAKAKKEAAKAEKKADDAGVDEDMDVDADDEDMEPDVQNFQIALEWLQRTGDVESLLHLPNLVFHEAGHVVFLPFGRFMTVLGGSLLQVLVPVICAGAFLLQHGNRFACAVSLWWAGENLVDLGPYIADARALQLPLIGGRTGAEVEGHDWEYLLTTVGLMSWDVPLGRLAHFAGSVIMLAALAWAAALVIQRRELTP